MLSAYVLISVVSLVVNIPCGYIRENYKKFSWMWLFWIHASIPVIVYLRITLKTSTLFIPVCIALAVIGQILGKYLRTKYGASAKAAF